MNKKQISQLISQARSLIDQLEKNLTETPKAVKKEKAKTFKCKIDGYTYIADPKGKWYSSYSPYQLENRCSLANFEPSQRFPSSNRYTRLPKEKTYKGQDGRLYQLNPKGNLQWNSPKPGGKDVSSGPFDPYPRDKNCPGFGKDIQRYYSVVKPSK